MTFQFSNPVWLLALAATLPPVLWLSFKSDVRIGPWRHWTALLLRLLVVLAVGLALAVFSLWLLLRRRPTPAGTIPAESILKECLTTP